MGAVANETGLSETMSAAAGRLNFAELSEQHRRLSAQYIESAAWYEGMLANAYRDVAVAHHQLSVVLEKQAERAREAQQEAREMGDTERGFSLSNQDDMISFVALMMASGSACSRCGYGTRKTSKRWARCKREGCGHRVRVLSMAEASEHLRTNGPVEPR